MNSQTTFTFDPKHGAMTTYALWIALGEALRVIGQMRGNDGWKEDLYDTCLQFVENLRTEAEEGDPVRLGELREMANEDARRAAIDAITSAFDRLKYIDDAATPRS